MIRVGIDTGGTFTDAVLMDDATGEMTVAKVPSTPLNMSDAFLQSVQDICDQLDIGLEDFDFLAHGTTVATNAVLQSKFATAGLITTQGFRDVLEIGTQMRPQLYSLRQEKPPPLIARRYRIEIPERVDSEGGVVTPLDEEAARGAVRQLRDNGVEAIAIAFLFSYMNPRHEQRVMDIVRDEAPGMYCCISSDLVAEFREYPRISTTATNACLAPVVSDYIAELSHRLKNRGLKTRLHIMQSNGGILSDSEATSKGAHNLVLSGPAAGVMGTAFVAQMAGSDEVISFDMGGTSTDVSAITERKPRYTVGFMANDAYPLQIPIIDIHTIGAGGGSIARVDSGGALKVGPESAGADPGPACYGRGGTHATVTDANLVLGRLRADAFLGGAMQLDVSLAEEVVDGLAEALSMSRVEAASGVLQVANANMAGAIRVVSTRKGLDPRDYALVAFGGAGPLHASELAEEIGIATVIVPPRPGLLSAMGLLLSDIKHDYSQTALTPLSEIDEKRIETLFEGMEARGAARLSTENIEPAAHMYVRSLDMRYVGQEYYLNVPLINLDLRDREALGEAFYSVHDRTYGHAAHDEPIEIVNLRVTAIGQIARPDLSNSAVREAQASEASPVSAHPVYFRSVGDFIDTPAYQRSELGPGTEFHGPAIVHQLDSTTVVLPNQYVRTDEHHNLILSFD